MKTLSIFPTHTFAGAWKTSDIFSTPYYNRHMHACVFVRHAYLTIHAPSHTWCITLPYLHDTESHTLYSKLHSQCYCHAFPSLTTFIDISFNQHTSIIPQYTIPTVNTNAEHQRLAGLIMMTIIATSPTLTLWANLPRKSRMTNSPLSNHRQLIYRWTLTTQRNPNPRLYQPIALNNWLK